MSGGQQPKRRSMTRTRSVERVRVICIRNTDYCVYDLKVLLAIFSKKVEADAYCQRLIGQQAT